MARDESDREDFLSEATALVERIELTSGAVIGNDHRAEAAGSDHRDTFADHVVVGFRRNGSASFFFGADPVYQFNAAGELRRAYSSGLLIKASHGRLVSLCRERQIGEMHLLSRSLTTSEEQAFIELMQRRLAGLAADIEAGRSCVLQQVPRGADVLGRVREWLAAHDGLPIANSPRVEA